MDNMTTNNENKSGISIGLDQLLPEDNKSVQLGLNYGQNECNSQRVLKENNTKRGKDLFGKKERGKYYPKEGAIRSGKKRPSCTVYSAQCVPLWLW